MLKTADDDTIVKTAYVAHCQLFNIVALTICAEERKFKLLLLPYSELLQGLLIRD